MLVKKHKHATDFLKRNINYLCQKKKHNIIYIWQHDTLTWSSNSPMFSTIVALRITGSFYNILLQYDAKQIYETCPPTI